MKMKVLTFFVFELFLNSAKGNSVYIEATQIDLKNVVKTADVNATDCLWSSKEICLMRHVDAVKYCSGKKMRLPTAREFALYSISQGAEDIIEPQNYHYQPNYSQLSPINENGIRDNFYYSYVGYKAPATQPKDLCLESSSVEFHPYYYEFAAGYGYIYYGALGSVCGSWYHAVICVP
jgi:hypothetical protein